LRFPLAWLAVVALAACVSFASAGETGFYGNGKWQEGQHAATRAKLVIIGKVLEAGKPSGKGWDGKYDQSSGNYQTRTCKIDLRQEVVIEVSEVLFGELKTGTRKLTVKMAGAKLNYQMVHMYFYQLVRQKKAQRRKRGLPVSIFALRKGKSYIFYLDAPKAEAKTKTKDKDKDKRLAASHLKEFSPMEAPEAELVRSVRAFCGEMKLWHRPPKLSEEQGATVKKLIADLGADDFDVREKADRALRAIGARLKPQLDKAARDGDEERSFRAKEILQIVKPEPAKAEFPRGGTGRRVPGIFKKRPKPKPKPKPDPKLEPEPEPDPKPAAEPEPVPPLEPGIKEL
jgi:hypothetical protein